MIILCGNFSYIEFILPNNLVTVFAAVNIGTDEKDEIKEMNKKMPYLVGVGESDKLGGKKRIRLYQWRLSTRSNRRQ